MLPKMTALIPLSGFLSIPIYLLAGGRADSASELNRRFWLVQRAISGNPLMCCNSNKVWLVQLLFSVVTHTFCHYFATVLSDYARFNDALLSDFDFN